jgi:hypothetical protein
VFLALLFCVCKTRGTCLKLRLLLVAALCDHSLALVLKQPEYLSAVGSPLPAVVGSCRYSSEGHSFHAFLSLFCSTPVFPKDPSESFSEDTTELAVGDPTSQDQLSKVW